MLTPITVSRLTVTTPPSKTIYSTGEVIDYSGIVITATYSDNSSEVVTNNCTFSPAAGKAFNANTDTLVEVSYQDSSCSFSLTSSESSTLLQIITPPTITSYAEGETIDYTGLVAAFVYPDNTQHDVTSYCDLSPAQGDTMYAQTNTAYISCAPALEPDVYDYNLGYVDNGVWKYENPTRTYVDIYEVLEGHTYSIRLGATVGSRFRCMFTTTDITQTTSNVTGTKIINTNSPAALAVVPDFTAPSNGYIIVAKDNVGVSGLISYVYDADAVTKSEVVSIPLNLVTLSSIAVTTMPTTTDYREGAAISYSGIVVTATMNDGSTREIPFENLIQSAKYFAKEDYETSLQRGIHGLALAGAAIPYSGIREFLNIFGLINRDDD